MCRSPGCICALWWFLVFTESTAIIPWETENQGFILVDLFMQWESILQRFLFTFLSFSICTLTNTCLLDTLCNMGFVEQFVALLQRDHDSTHEHLLAALLALTQCHPPSIEECRRSEFLFREFLDNRIELIGDRDECLVIIISQYLKMKSNFKLWIFIW